MSCFLSPHLTTLGTQPIILRAPRRGVVCARLRAKLKILGFAPSVTVTQFLSHHLQSGKRHIKTSGRVLGESQVNTWPHSTFNLTTGGNKHSKVDSAHLNWQMKSAGDAFSSEHGRLSESNLKIMTGTREYYRGKYHCTRPPVFPWSTYLICL
jgi:hypothetical protein